ncbi:MAG: DUF4450 domain-containing protein [Verrucomicrobia bacterium]|nr:DUF4450 domain-containing protein [Verrucomicrobiota bacterium]
MPSTPPSSPAPARPRVSMAGPWREPGQAVSAEYLRDGALRYEAADHEIVGRNGPYFNNRPLYCRLNTDGAVLTGDRPFVRLIAKPYLLGALALAVRRGSLALWLHDWQEVESRYRAGRMTWHCHDPRIPRLAVTLTVVPLCEVAGFAAHLEIAGVQAGDALAWSFGGARAEDGDPRLNWDPVMRGNPEICRSGDPRRPLLFQGPVPELAVGNVVSASGTTFRVAASAEAAQAAFGWVTRADQIGVGEAGAVPDAAALPSSKAGPQPVAEGVTALQPGTDQIFLAVEGAAADCDPDRLRASRPERAYEEGLGYVASTERARSESPDARLDAALAAVCHAIDGNCERDPYIFRHGCMAFSCRFVGWRVICGATALGWHERVRGNAEYTIGLQKVDDPARTRPQANPERMHCHEGPGSRLYGRGSLDRDYTIYDVQSQFFDQTIQGWRASADPELERLLRPALELHCEWMRECFDPDDDGLYESYINTLPTDSVWYSGGGGAEQSAYAYTAHRAAADLARRAGDRDAMRRHQRQAAKIQQAMRDKLWLPARGHFGLFREQGGLGRVHEDAWTYSVFLPIDAGLTTPAEALESLYYTEWALERIRLPFGGVLVQPSNWVPWKWSVRDMFGGDLFHLALAHFQTGLGDAGYEILQGATLESAYASAVPGGFSHIGAATDFGDNSHMFARAVVEGLYGYVPDYPNDQVLVRPAFPFCWPRAELTTPDCALRYRQVGDADHYGLRLARAAAVTFRVPVRAERLVRVTVNGGEVSPSLAPGLGCTQLEIAAGRGDSFEVVIELEHRTPQTEPVTRSGRVGDELDLRTALERVEAWRDHHEILEWCTRDECSLRGTLADRPGHHLVLALGHCGELPRWQVFKVHITDPAGEAARKARTPRTAAPGAGWDSVSLDGHFNGDIRTIFQQRYLSPRPATCSVRIGDDGYTAWTMFYWNQRPPPIDLGQVPALRGADGLLTTPAGARFAFGSEDRNVVFTSRWDNWPTEVTVPVDRAAKAVWLLVAGSTFPMQTRIANAEFRFEYADGVVERLELVPPYNFWMLSSWGGCDYDLERDAFCFPDGAPLQVQLGRDCRAMVLAWTLRPGVALSRVTLATLSEEVVVGLLGLSLELA